MSRPLDAEVLVVGGGPAGAATAWALARNGVDVLVVDRAAFPRPKPCAEYLSPQATRLLDEMGVLGALDGPGATRLAGMRIVAPDGTRCEGRFSGAHGYAAHRPFGLAVRRERLDALLLDAARGAGARVAESCTVRDVGPRAGDLLPVHVTAHDESHTLRARRIIGADGLRSVVARRTGLARRLRWPSRWAFVTHYSGVEDLTDLGEMHVAAGGYCGIAPVGEGIANVAVVVESAGTGAASGDSARLIDGWIAALPALRARFRGARRVSPVRATGPFASRARRAFSPAGIALVGDAADFFDPFTGEGIYAALRGAELLVPYVIESLRAPTARGAHEALAAYDRCRRHEFGGKWRLEQLVAVAVAIPTLMDAAVARLSVRPDLADLLVGVTGDFVPPSAVLNLAFVRELFGASLARAA